MPVHIDDLPLEMLELILSFLDDKQLFLVERVSKKWQKRVLKMLKKEKTLKKLDYYSKKFKDDPSGRWNIINDNNIDILKKILSKCPDIKILDLSCTNVTGNNNLLLIANLCNKLESINFNNSNITVSENEIEQFIKKIGPQLIKFSQFLHFKMELYKHMENIEDISFYTWTTERIDQFFHIINNHCKSLKVLSLGTSSIGYNIQNNDMINVLQRIEHLVIQVEKLPSFQFDLNNLTELSLYGDHMYWTTLTKMKFANVTKLNVEAFYKIHFISISKFKFPKLESVTIMNANITRSFINQIKNIKSLEINELNPSIISELNHLTDLVCKEITLRNDKSFVRLFKFFDNLLHHNLFKNIKFEIYDLKLKIYNESYEKLASLCKAKPNTKIVIKIDKPSSSSSKATQKFIDYKKLFDETKHLHKFNIIWEF